MFTLTIKSEDKIKIYEAMSYIKLNLGLDIEVKEGTKKLGDELRLAPKVSRQISIKEKPEKKKEITNLHI